MKAFLDNIYETRSFTEAMEAASVERRTLRKWFQDEWFLSEILYTLQLLQYETLFAMANGAVKGSVKSASVLLKYENNISKEEKEKVIVEILNKEFNLINDLESAARKIKKKSAS